MLIFHSFKASGSTFSRLHQRLLKSFKEAAISLRHLEKSILEGNLYLGPLEMILRTLASGMTFRLPVITTNFKLLQKTNYTSDTKCLAVFIMGNQWPFKKRVQILGLLWNLLGNADFVLLMKAQITRMTINLPKLFFIN